MSRLWQIFVAPGDGSDALPIDRSPWYSGRTVTLPKEHWEVILQFAASINKQAAQKLTSYARSENYFDDDNIHVSREELDSILVFMEKLSQKSNRQRHWSRSQTMIPLRISRMQSMRAW